MKSFYIVRYNVIARAPFGLDTREAVFADKISAREFYRSCANSERPFCIYAKSQKAIEYFEKKCAF